MSNYDSVIRGRALSSWLTVLRHSSHMSSLPPIQIFATMTQQARPIATVITVGPLNALAVMSLYMPQIVLPAVLPDVSSKQEWLSITAVFLGYCAGNAITVFNIVPLISRSTKSHLVLLSVALLLTTAAPTMPAFTVACFLTGVGASAAQRLLGLAAHRAGPSRAGNAVTGCVAAALLAVLGLRVWGKELASALGWRTMFVLMSVPFIGWSCIGRSAVGRAAFEGARPATTQDTPVDAIRLILSSAVLRGSMAQQAMVFATYSAAWILLAAQLAPGERATASFWGPLAGVVCLLGSGILIGRGRIQWLNQLGNAAMFVPGCPLLLLAYAGVAGATGWISLNPLMLLPLGMAVIDAGMQVTLITNQTRVQAIAPASRGRLASLLTISGSLGGAFGGGFSQFLWQHYGWQAALALVTVTAASGLFVACAPMRSPNPMLEHRRERRGMYPARITFHV